MPKPTRRLNLPASHPKSASLRELTTKRRGELAELAFTLKAARLGFGVCRPFGDSERYDAIIDARAIAPTPKHRCSPACPTIQGAQSRKAAKQVQAHQAEEDAGVRPNAFTPEPSRTLGRSGRIPLSREPKRARRFGSRTPVAVSRSCPALRVVTQTDARQPWCPPQPVAPLWRVQVKCSTQLTDGLYHLNAHRRTGGRAVPYLPGEIDFLAAYIIPEDTWYIIPLEAFLGSTSLLFRRQTDRKPGQYDQYREAWHLLRPR